MTGPTPASGPAAPLAPEECAAFGQQARALLYTLDSRPLADVDPATVRECTAFPSAAHTQSVGQRTPSSITQRK